MSFGKTPDADANADKFSNFKGWGYIWLKNYQNCFTACGERRLSHKNLS